MDNLKWFLDPIKQQYFDFEGRATLQQFWMFTAWSFGIMIVLSVLKLGGLGFVYALAVLAPSLAIGARRLHDTGRSGWWQLVNIIPFGVILLIIFLASEGKEGDNEYGADPRAVKASPLPSPTSEMPSSATPVPISPTESGAPAEVTNTTPTEHS